MASWSERQELAKIKKTIWRKWMDIIVVFLFAYLCNTLAFHLFRLQAIIKMFFFTYKDDTIDLDLQPVAASLWLVT